MSLKKIIPVLLMAMCITLVTPLFASSPNPATTNETPKEVMARQIENRLIEIKNMDKTNLSNADKKDLRKEVKSLKKKASNNGIYLSVGAIIIIILLLILLL